MLTVALVVVLLATVVLGAELVRSACRRQLMNPLAPMRSSATARVDVD